MHHAPATYVAVAAPVAAAAAAAVPERGGTRASTTAARGPVYHVPLLFFLCFSSVLSRYKVHVYYYVY